MDLVARRVQAGETEEAFSLLPQVLPVSARWEVHWEVSGSDLRACNTTASTPGIAAFPRLKHQQAALASPRLALRLLGVEALITQRMLPDLEWVMCC